MNGTAATVRFSDSAERVACAEWLELVAIGHLVALVRWRQSTNRRRDLAERSDVMFAARAPSSRGDRTRAGRVRFVSSQERERCLPIE